MRPLVQRLGYVAINATDPAAVAHDHVNIVGARVVEETPTTIMLSANRRHAEFLIHQADHNGLAAVGLVATSADAVDEVADRCRAAGLAIVSETPSLPAIEKSVTYATSDGHRIEVHTPMAEDRPARYQGPGARPNYLDHANFTSPDPQRWTEEMIAACGLLLSERTSGRELSWLRAADGRHHTVAVAKSPVAGLHHVSWDFSSFEDMKVMADNLIVEQRRIIWGPGRHGAGDNIFQYFFDASGLIVEATSEMEIIDDDTAEVRVAEPGENLSNWRVVNQWGIVPPIEWVEHHFPLAQPTKLAA